MGKQCEQRGLLFQDRTIIIGLQRRTQSDQKEMKESEKHIPRLNKFKKDATQQEAKKQAVANP